MNIIFLLLCCSIFIALLFLGGFIWSVRSGQYDDAVTPAMRMLMDEPSQPTDHQMQKKEAEESDSKT